MAYAVDEAAITEQAFPNGDGWFIHSDPALNSLGYDGAETQARLAACDCKLPEKTFIAASGDKGEVIARTLVCLPRTCFLRASRLQALMKSKRIADKSEK